MIKLQSQFNGEWIVYSPNDAGNTRCAHIPNQKLFTPLYHIQNINLKWNRDLMLHQNTKLLLENKREIFCEFRLGKKKLRCDTKSTIHKRKNWLTRVHQNNCCSSKDTAEKEKTSGRKYLQTIYLAQDL